MNRVHKAKEELLAAITEEVMAKLKECGVYLSPEEFDRMWTKINDVLSGNIRI